MHPEENNRPKSIFNTEADTSSCPIRVQVESSQVNGREIHRSCNIYGTLFCSESPLSWKQMELEYWWGGALSFYDCPFLRNYSEKEYYFEHIWIYLWKIQLPQTEVHFILGDHGCTFLSFYRWLPWKCEIIIHSCRSAENLQRLLNKTAVLIWTNEVTSNSVYFDVKVLSKWLHKINGYCSERSDVVGWPWLAAKWSSSHSLNPPSLTGQENIRCKCLWVETKMGISLTNYHHGQYRLNFGKIDFPQLWLPSNICPYLHRLSPRHPPMDERLSSALWWGHWSQLEPAVSSTGCSSQGACKIKTEQLYGSTNFWDPFKYCIYLVSLIKGVNLCSVIRHMLRFSTKKRV